MTDFSLMFAAGRDYSANKPALPAVGAAFGGSGHSRIHGPQQC
jgi:hypothetical protein